MDRDSLKNRINALTYLKPAEREAFHATIDRFTDEQLSPFEVSLTRYEKAEAKFDEVGGPKRDEFVADFRQSLHVEEREKLKAAEAAERSDELQEAEDLLSEL
jgi:hypothetical protein